MKVISYGVLLLVISLGATQVALAGTESDTNSATGTSTADASVEVGQDEARFDVEVGKTQDMKNCRGCHGPKAKGLASYPKLAGKPADYLADKLERYRAGEKLGPNTMLMAPNAKNLSDEDIGNIVQFIVTTFE